MRLGWQALNKCMLGVCLLVLLTPLAAARTGNYLIVAPQSFAGSTPITQLADARAAQGLTVTVMTVPVGTTKETLRAQIVSWYTPGQPGYVLIVGDSDSESAPATTTMIPHWDGGGWHTTPTDLPYACFDGADDWYPEVTIGRFPVDTVAELQAAVDKTLFVEAGDFPDPGYTKRAALLACDDTGAGAEPTHEWVIANCLTPAGFSTTRIYVTQGGGTPQITAALNNGVLFMTYFGHSGFTSWWAPAFNTTDIQALSNTGHYGLILSISCGTAQFCWGYGECMGEIWLREADKGAAAYIATTDLIWSAPSSAWESVRRLEKYFYQAVFHDGIWEVGPAWQAAQYKLLADPDYGPSHTHTRDYFEMFVLIGDPALRLPHDPAPTGDFDEDGDVDLTDFAQFQTCFGGAATGLCAAGDLAGGGTIALDDFDLLATVLAGPQ